MRHSSLALWCVCLYGWFSVLPHIHALRHAHIADGAHIHSTASLHQAEMEREALASLSEEEIRNWDLESLSNASDAGDKPAQAKATTKDKHSSLSSHDRGWSDPDANWHSHFFTDPNCIALAITWQAPANIHAKVLLPAWSQPAFPSLSPFPPQARGPPTT